MLCVSMCVFVSVRQIEATHQGVEMEEKRGGNKRKIDGGKVVVWSTQVGPPCTMSGAEEEAWQPPGQHPPHAHPGPGRPHQTATPV